jgi:uncharacterized protein (TIGR00255 family)
MIRSMTAFASGEAQIGSLTVSCELRSVNHRYCDLSFKLPERLRFLESDLRTTMAAQLKRGKIECAFNYKKQSQDGQVFKINSEAVQALLAATAEIEAMMPQARPFSALEVLAFPTIQQEQEIDKAALQAGLLDLLQQTLQQLCAVREREGQQLAALVAERCLKINELVKLAQQRMPQVLALLRSKSIERITELVANPDFDRLEQELVQMAQKLDVEEELDRLNTHLIEVQRNLQLDEAVGRRLDFLMQELHREANTLGSKSADKEMTQLSIEMKVLIEQMREQIQNIE